MQDLALFKKYKNQFLALCFLLGGIGIIFQVILPLYGSLTSQISKNAEEQKKLTDMNASFGLIQSSNENMLRNDVITVANALPSEKDLSGIYTSLTNAALSSGVVFDGFTLKPGSIYGEEKEESQGFPSVDVAVKLSNVDNVSFREFLTALRTSFPLSEVVEVKLLGGTATVDVKYYYKPYNLSTINNDIIHQLTSSEENLLKTLKESESSK